MSTQENNWYNWHWQFANRLRTIEDFSTYLELTDEEKTALNAEKRFATGVTPYFASLLDKTDHNCPLRRQAIPITCELKCGVNDLIDPLNEDEMSPVDNLVHRYPDRILLIVTETCHMYCRHCTRRRRVGFKESVITHKQLSRAVDYIKNKSQIRDVLISGGDPLTLSDDLLETIITQIRNIDHVEIIRIGTRAPIVNPYRITEDLVSMLRRYHPIWINLQFNHHREITDEATKACSLLADAGIPLGNQTVLLRGINDTVEIQKKLIQQLIQIRVRPYYLYQCDLAEGLEHFRTPVSLGMQIMENLHGHTSGFAIPSFVIDAPGGGGKIPVLPQYIIDQTPKKVILRNYEGRIFTYPEPNI